jgi:hypothetical protein
VEAVLFWRIPGAEAYRLCREPEEALEGSGGVAVEGLLFGRWVRRDAAVLSS